MSLETLADQEHNGRSAAFTTPANCFPPCEGRCTAGIRKPLIVVSPRVCRHFRVRLIADDFIDEEMSQTEQGHRFKRLIMDKSAASRAEDDSLPVERDVKRVVFCTGKVYYEDAGRRARGDGRGGRMSRSYASGSSRRFRGTSSSRELRRVSGTPRAGVVLEEPMNMGAYSQIAPRFVTLLQAGKHRWGSWARC